MSLVLSRREGESVDIGDEITVTVVEINPGQVRLAFDAPKDIAIKRDNIINDQPKEGNR
tara:strand:+ start:3735 stop:3911 length:177 start_codon:yes stop_codon:yes gene_type:complete